MPKFIKASPTRLDKRKKSAAELLWSVFRFIILLGLAYILLYPLIYMVSMALRPAEQVTDPTIVWIPRSLTLDNVVNVFKAMDFGNAFKTTFLIFVVSGLLEVLTCAVVGYGFARFNFPGKGLWFIGVVLTILVPTQCIMIPLTVQFRYFDFFGLGSLGAIFGQKWTVNLLNTPFALYVPSLFASGIRSGLFIFIYRQFFLGLAPELEDAAYIDGCGPLKTFLRVMLPLSSGAMIIVLLLSIVAHWNDSLYSTFFFDNLNTLSTQLSLLGTTVEQATRGMVDGLDVAYKQAGAMLFMLFPLAIFIIFQRWFTESIQTAGIVG